MIMPIVTISMIMFTAYCRIDHAKWGCYHRARRVCGHADHGPGDFEWCLDDFSRGIDSDADLNADNLRESQDRGLLIDWLVQRDVGKLVNMIGITDPATLELLTPQPVKGE